MSNELVIKVQFRDDIRLIRTFPDTPFNELMLQVQRVFQDEISTDNKVVLKYHDEDGDLVKILSNSDLRYAVKCSQMKTPKILVDVSLPTLLEPTASTRRILDIVEKDPASLDSNGVGIGNITKMKLLLEKLFASNPQTIHPFRKDLAVKPDMDPLVWITKFNSKEKQICYELRDGTVGMLFGVADQLLLLADQKTFQYVSGDQNHKSLFTKAECPPECLDKVNILLERFKKLATTGDLIPRDEIRRAPSTFVQKWSKHAEVAIMMYLSSGTIQVNYLKECFKLIFCPSFGSVTVVTNRKVKPYQPYLITYEISLLEKHGCDVELLDRLKYVHKLLTGL